ncbi:putative AMP-binding enzyme [Lindgomyces ingoldianus]|uniref:AMP-binding enzyme n=1 Tax=Lindgomyces ingoldianus TaxID=673940 RepID=A0ACB6QA80_9PLEO|nr:putative AMP-binding enzyme [Lindgomyces ingoldianus]KAF2463873.1 putative AMP-binding enzyme [Lindgomyces ingoldianus]
MALANARGSRSILSLIDQYAVETPSRVWAAVPLDDSDLGKGFTDITFTRLANAINHAAAWMTQNLGPASMPYETIAYTGPKDLRYPIVALAVAKISRKLLLPSPYASKNAQAHLLDHSDCRYFLHAASFGEEVKKVLFSTQRQQAKSIEIPSLGDWLTEKKAPYLPFSGPWKDVASIPWLIFHTSGTTGLPKLVTYTHQMMASLDAAELMPDGNEETMNRHFEKKRWYTPLPSLHFVGMTVALQFTVYLGAVLVVGPASPGPTSPHIARCVLERGKVEGAMLPPALIEGLCEDDAGLESLRRLEHLYFAGAPMPRKAAEKLLGHVPVKPAMGSTEAGAYFLKIIDQDDWEYYSFRPAMGLKFRLFAKDLYEPVFVRHPSIERWQQVFQVYPDLQEFSTKDLFSPHPSMPGRWKYVGRTDDVVILSHGECLYAAGLEEMITAHADLSAVLIGGQGRARPFAIIESKGNLPMSTEDHASFISVIDSVNKSSSELVKLHSDMLIYARSEKPLVRTPKGTIARRESEQLYAKEIELLYVT